ncbi:MAG: SIMPL domain-containing protein [Gammaproteobacteria bacterium]|nr:SIMPL domain-containing protein [Gammaproteobacteria bacterium]
MKPVLLAALLAASPMVGAQDVLHYDQIDLSATAESSVANDLLVAVLYVQSEGVRQRDVADEVNQTMRWALDTAKSVRGVEVQTLQYSTFPTYDRNNRVIGWRANQSLRLQSADSKVLSDLVGKLQEKLAVESIGYEISKAARDTAEDALIADALAQFKNRAQAVANELDRDGYRIVRINIGSSGLPSPMMYRGRAAMAMDMKEVAPAALEAGDQRMNVMVNGTIELNPPR